MAESKSRQTKVFASSKSKIDAKVPAKSLFKNNFLKNIFNNSEVSAPKKPKATKTNNNNYNHNNKINKSSMGKNSELGQKVFYGGKTKNDDSRNKVIKPNNQEMLREKLGTAINSRISRPKRQFNFGFKPLFDLKQQSSQFVWSDIPKSVNFLLTSINFFKRTDALIAFLIATCLVLFLTYLSFFDTYFLVKDYTIKFTPNSYLGSQEVNLLLDKFSNYKILTVFPSNQYWFLNDKNMTLTAQSVVPEIQSVRITRRIWPSKVELEITTEPILLTLAIIENNQLKYWRISPSGNVVTQDEAGLRENLVFVEKNISFDRPGITLQNYPVFKDRQNLNRLYFVLTTWEYLRRLEIEPLYSVLPSLVDTDLSVQTKNQTKLLFNAKAMDKEAQQKRLQAVFSSTIKDREIAGELAYIDFRISRRIFICPKGKECEKDVE